MTGVLAALGMPMAGWRAAGLGCFRGRRHLADEVPGAGARGLAWCPWPPEVTARSRVCVTGVADAARAASAGVALLACAGTVGRSVRRGPPRDLLAKLGEGRWVTRGGVVLTVNGDGDVGRAAAGGRGAGVPVVRRCAGRVGERAAAAGADAEGPDAVLVPRRSRCRGCGATHVLLPAWCLLRRADAAAVIGAALAAAAAGDGHRKIAGRLGRAAPTVRGWLRRFARAGGGGAGVLHGAAGPDRPGSGDAGRVGERRGGGGVGDRGRGGGGRGAVAASSARCRYGRRRRRPAAGCCWRRAGRAGSRNTS